MRILYLIWIRRRTSKQLALPITKVRPMLKTIAYQRAKRVLTTSIMM